MWVEIFEIPIDIIIIVYSTDRSLFFNWYSKTIYLDTVMKDSLVYTKFTSIPRSVTHLNVSNQSSNIRAT